MNNGRKNEIGMWVNRSRYINSVFLLNVVGTNDCLLCFFNTFAMIVSYIIEFCICPMFGFGNYPSFFVFFFLVKYYVVECYLNAFE